MKYNRITKQELEPLIKDSICYAEVLRKLGLKAVGGNYANLVRRIDRFNLDCSHFLGQASNQGKEF